MLIHLLKLEEVAAKQHKIFHVYLWPRKSSNPFSDLENEDEKELETTAG